MGKGRAPCCAKVGLNKGSWTPEEDMRLIAYIHKHGHVNWRALPRQAGTYVIALAAEPYIYQTVTSMPILFKETRLM